jgi:hypothetical protein
MSGAGQDHHYQRDRREALRAPFTIEETAPTGGRAEDE